MFMKMQSFQTEVGSRQWSKESEVTLWFTFSRWTATVLSDCLKNVFFPITSKFAFCTLTASQHRSASDWYPAPEDASPYIDKRDPSVRVQCPTAMFGVTSDKLLFFLKIKKSKLIHFRAAHLLPVPTKCPTEFLSGFWGFFPDTAASLALSSSTTKMHGHDR